VALFALLALMGDLGCSLGPWVVGLVTDGISRRASAPSPGRFFHLLLTGQGNSPLQAGILVCVLFPLVFALGVLAFKRHAAGGNVIQNFRAEISRKM
jgi:hypothetical protein